jgi:hypothetical protein
MIRILSALMLVTSLAQPVAAQVAGSVEFNLFELEGASSNRIFIFDEAYTRQYGVEVPAPFSLLVPDQPGVELIADGHPDGGAFLRFTFVTGDPRQFVENIQVVTATIPMLAEAEDPEAARLQMSVALLRDRVYPVAVEGFDEARILAMEIFEFNGHLGVQLIGQYTDPAIGPMLLRLTAHPNPAQPESYVTVANINLTLVPVTDGETLRQSLSGRVANSLSFTPQ